MFPHQFYSHEDLKVEKVVRVHNIRQKMHTYMYTYIYQSQSITVPLTQDLPNSLFNIHLQLHLIALHPLVEQITKCKSVWSVYDALAGLLIALYRIR